MGWLLALIISAALAAEPPIDIDPNTKTQGGADVRDSDSAAGANVESVGKTRRDKARVDERGEVAIPDKENGENDKPISARKPHNEREPEAPKSDTRQ